MLVIVHFHLVVLLLLLLLKIGHIDSGLSLQSSIDEPLTGTVL
jgi:hypothetical protein